MEPSEHAVTQYAQTSGRLTERIEILDYDTHSEHWYSWVRSRIPMRGKSVLEVGAGTGALWKDSQIEPDTQLTLTDFSPAMCQTLRSVSGVTRIEECDASNLPFADSSFDTAIANHMLYHLDDPSLALKELARVLKPEGTLFVTLNGRDHIQEIIDIGGSVGRTSSILHRARITAETAPEAISKWLSLVSTERCPGSFEVPRAEPVLHYLNSWGELPLGTEDEAKVRALVEPKIAAEGKFRITKHMVLFTARRLG